jgi:hypothetical protein
MAFSTSMAGMSLQSIDKIRVTIGHEINTPSKKK